MKRSQLPPLVRGLLKETSSKKFLIGITLGVAFSISVILSTIGIMDGFTITLKKALLKSGGEHSIISRMGFFNIEEELAQTFSYFKVKDFSPMVQTEAFLIVGENSKGVLVKGIDPESFEKVTREKIDLSKGGIAIGEELKKYLSLKMGQKVTLAFAKGNRNVSGLPLLKRFRVESSFQTGVYKKDLRVVYMFLEDLQMILNVEKRINVMEFNTPKSFAEKTGDSEKLFAKLLETQISHDYIVRPFWREFKTLIDAVEVEKFMIGFILQLIVIISIFNVAAFIIFLNDQRSQEIFLFRAVGLSMKSLLGFWVASLSVLWLASCFISILFIKIFDLILKNATLFKLPGDIYSLEGLSIILDFSDYFLVFILAFIWLMIVSYPILKKMKKMSVVEGLRKEFS